VDQETSLKDNRADGEAGVGLTDAGHPGVVTAVGSTRSIAVGSTGEAVAYLRVSKRQGDNYRVTASMDEAEIASFVPRNASLTGEVLTATGTPVTKNITEMLTVWRTLHLEIDSLDGSALLQSGPDPSGTGVVLDLLGVASAVEESRLVDNTAPFVNPAPKGSGLVDHSRRDDWVWADLFSPTQSSPSIKVIENDKTSIRVAAGLDLRQIFQLGQPFIVRDDFAQALGAPPLGLGTTILALTYVRVAVIPESDNARRTHRMLRNLKAAMLARLPKDVASSPNYWSVMVVDAFDPDVPRDNDPSDPSSPTGSRRNEVATLGETVGQVLQPHPPSGVSGLVGQVETQPICSVYREAIRDASEEGSWGSTPVSPLESTLAHELICHALSLGHVRATLCNDIHIEGEEGIIFPANLLAHLRGLPQPKGCANTLCPY